MKDALLALKNHPGMAKAFAFLEADRERTMEEQLEICAIPAPSNHEEKRIEDFHRRFQSLGFDECWVDEVGNVHGRIKGTGGGPTLMVAAHLDTVFGFEVDTTPVIKDGVVYAPGIADDTRGMAELLTITRALHESGLRPMGDIIICGNVAEEGLGDLKGAKHIFKTMTDIDGFISIDGTGAGSLTFDGTGSYRYKVTYSGTGGHSFGAFGIPNCIHAFCRAGAKIADIQVPTDPKTTYNIGVVQGGTSVNSIAFGVEILIDMRSNSAEALDALDEKVLAALKEGCEEENARWNHPTERVEVTIERVGTRPAGQQNHGDPIVLASIASCEICDIAPQISAGGSTDCNIPISLGIPAVAIGRGGMSRYGHSLKEEWAPIDEHLAPQRTLLLALALTGVEGVIEPILPIRR
jgi:tripeptide aminopeptidase